MTSFYNIEVKEAPISEKPILRRLIELYLYDFSEYEKADVDSHGLYGYKYLDHYWTESGRHPYLVRVDGELAGLALVNRHAIGGEDRWSMAEFFIMKKYRRKGIGEHVAVSIFDLWPGKWQVMQIEAHPDSHAFWRKVIGRYTGGQYEEFQSQLDEHTGPVQNFDSSTRPRSE